MNNIDDVFTSLSVSLYMYIFALNLYDFNIDICNCTFFKHVLFLVPRKFIKSAGAEICVNELSLALYISISHTGDMNEVY